MIWRSVDDSWTTQQCKWLGSSSADETSKRLQSYQRFWHELHTSTVLREVANVMTSAVGKIEVVGQPDSVKRTIASALSRERFPGSGLSYEVKRFSSRCIPRVVAAGQAPFEIVFTKDCESAAAPGAFHLMHVENLKRRLGRQMQYVPGKGWTRIRGNCLVVFKLDRRRRIAVQNAMRALGAASRYERCVFDFQNRHPEHDYAAHMKVNEIALTRVSNSMGWKTPNFRDYALEPYDVSRFFVRYEFESVLRQMVIDGLNRALRIAGEKMGFDAKLVCSGYRGEDEIAEARKRLEDGRCAKLVDLIDPFLYHG